MFQNIPSNEIRSNDLACLDKQYWLISLVLRETDKDGCYVIAHRNGVKRKFRLTGDEVLHVNRTNERFAPKELTWCDVD